MPSEPPSDEPAIESDHYTVSVRFEGEEWRKLRAVAAFQSASYTTAIQVAVDSLYDRLFNS